MKNAARFIYVYSEIACAVIGVSTSFAAKRLIGSTGDETVGSKECQRPRWSISSQSPQVQIEWKVLRGEPCASHVTGSLHNFSISASPKHGFAAVNNSLANHGFGYKPSAGYLGSDNFEIKGEIPVSWQPDPVEATISVHVEVVDHL
jgi:hypothetical protein